jgi:hypothetical protein
MDFTMIRTKHTFLFLFIGAAIGACDPNRTEETNGLGEDDASASDAGEDADGGMPESPRGYAVVSGDYSVVSIGILHPDGKLREREIIHSGSAPAGLVTALSGDVRVANNVADPGVLTLIDRFRTDVITRLDLASGDVLGQVKTHTPNAESIEDAYSSNPQDYVFIDDDHAWVSRYEPNPDVAASHVDHGTDLLRLKPADSERTKDRITFSEWNSEGEREGSTTGATETVTVYARPTGMVRLGDYVAVGIEAMSIGFDAVGTGMVALVDLEAQEVVHMLELDGLQNCGDIDAVPNDATRVAVACSGFYRGVQRDGSGLAVLQLDGERLSVEHIWRAKEHPDDALTIYGVCGISATEVVATAGGGIEQDDEGEPLQPNDKLFLIDVASGEQTEILEAGASYVIGGAAYDASRKLLLVPDATTGSGGEPSAGVRRYERNEDGEFEELSITKIDDILPPRQIRAFY